MEVLVERGMLTKMQRSCKKGNEVLRGRGRMIRKVSEVVSAQVGRGQGCPRWNFDVSMARGMEISAFSARVKSVSSNQNGSSSSPSMSTW